MIRHFKEQFIIGILSTFATGLLCGATTMMIDCNTPIKMIIIASIFSLFLIICTTLYWKTLFRKLNLEDKIKSIYTDID